MNKIDYFVSTENCDVLIEKDSKRITDDIGKNTNIMLHKIRKHVIILAIFKKPLSFLLILLTDPISCF